MNELTIVSFQGAEKRYPKWLSKSKNEGRFFGISDQLTQVKLLQMKRYDVVLCDKYIFKYFVRQLNLINGISDSDFVEHQFTTVDPDDYRPVFRSKAIRDDFNKGLKMIKASGEFQQIYNKYLN